MDRVDMLTTLAGMDFQRFPAISSLVRPRHDSGVLRLAVMCCQLMDGISPEELQ
jgi:hypothetical protein